MSIYNKKEKNKVENINAREEAKYIIKYFWREGFFMDEIKVIIADDNIEILNKLKEILEKISKIKLLGIAKAGKEEYEIIKNMKPDLVLTDLEMPELTGIEVLEKLEQEKTEKIPQVIFITGKPSTDFIKRAIKIGALDIIYKPFKDEKIEDIIERNKNVILEEKNQK